MSAEYHWPCPKAVRELNHLLALPATGREQDWEIELADPNRLGEMLELFRSGSLDLEARSALGLLIVFALEAVEGEGSPIAQVRAAFRWDPDVLPRLRSYWDRSGRSAIAEAVLA